MNLKRTLIAAISTGTTVAALLGAGYATAGCTNCADHKYWPRIDGVFKKQSGNGPVTYTGTSRSDELLGHHGSDTLRGRDGSDVLWGDWDPKGQPSTQTDTIYGAGGTDFIYGSHGRNVILAGAGNDVVSIHYGRGSLDCGPGRDIYHVARTRKKGYKIRNCEKVDYRPESQRGALKPLP
jgi:RTX calcium-binding nonapeptide repeat (4 copies)